MKLIKQTFIALAVAASLSACGGGDEGGTSSTGSSASSTAPDSSNLQSCIAKTWIMGAEQFAKGVQAVGDGATITGSSGQQTNTFSSGGAYSGTSDYTLFFTRGGTSGSSHYAGTATGSWSLAGDMLTITRTSSNVTVTNNIGGVVSTYGSGTGSPSTVKVISCTPATLTYDQTLSSGTVVRIVLVSA